MARFRLQYQSLDHANSSVKYKAERHYCFICVRKSAATQEMEATMRNLQNQVHDAAKREAALQQKLRAARQELREMSAAYEEEVLKVL